MSNVGLAIRSQQLEVKNLLGFETRGLACMGAWRTPGLTGEISSRLGCTLVVVRGEPADGPLECGLQVGGADAGL
jgi:hypothetical protein